MSMVRIFRDVLKDTRGATAVEYGLIISMIVLAMVSALQGLANQTITMWTDVSDKVTSSE